MNLKFRQEEKKDYKQVEIITREAFYNDKEYQEKGYGCSEHYMLHLLRYKDGIKNLSIVATNDDEIIGHIIYSKSHIFTNDKRTIDTITLGPVSVAKKYQKRGIGKALIEHSINLAKTYSYGAIILFGHPNYYPKFGFKPASDYNITTKDGSNFDAFMALELKAGYLANVSGKFFESEVFDEKSYKREIIIFDKSF
ncbi:MAG: GNAT family N-acetyltransferase [Bacillota bacterium]